MHLRAAMTSLLPAVPSQRLPAHWHRSNLLKCLPWSGLFLLLPAPFQVRPCPRLCQAAAAAGAARADSDSDSAGITQAGIPLSSYHDVTVASGILSQPQISSSRTARVHRGTPRATGNHRPNLNATGLAGFRPNPGLRLPY